MVNFSSKDVHDGAIFYFNSLTSRNEANVLYKEIEKKWEYISRLSCCCLERRRKRKIEKQNRCIAHISADTETNDVIFKSATLLLAERALLLGHIPRGACPNLRNEVTQAISKSNQSNVYSAFSRSASYINTYSYCSVYDVGQDSRPVRFRVLI